MGSVTNVGQQSAYQVGGTQDASYASGVTDVQQKKIDDSPILRGQSVEVQNKTGSAQEVSLPELDADEALASFMNDLEKLIAELTLENEQSQLKATKERIEVQLKTLETKHKETLAKISDAMELQKEQAEKAEKNRILGWIMTAVTVLATALTCVMTFGAATPLAVAACSFAVAGCALQLTQQIMSETGAMDKLIDDRAEEIMKEHPEMSTAEAKAKASGEISTAFMVASCVLGLLSLGCGIGMLAGAGGQAVNLAAKVFGEGSKIATKLASETFQLVAKLAQTALSLLSLAGGIASTVNSWELLYLQKESSEQEAEIAELQAMLEQINAAIDEEEEALQLLLDSIQKTMGVITQLLEAGSAEADEILQNLNMSI